MKPHADIHAINDKIQAVKALLTDLNRDAEEFPAMAKNSKRALASVKMMELNVSDLITFDLAPAMK